MEEAHEGTLFLDEMGEFDLSSVERYQRYRHTRYVFSLTLALTLKTVSVGVRVKSVCVVTSSDHTHSTVVIFINYNQPVMFDLEKLDVYKKAKILMPEFGHLLRPGD